MNGLLGILEMVLDSPAVQGPAAAAVAAFLKSKLPDGAEKDVKDFLAAVSAAL